MGDLIQKIKTAQVVANENAVMNNLTRMGLIKPRTVDPKPILFHDNVEEKVLELKTASLKSAQDALAIFGAKVLRLYRNDGDPGDIDGDDLHHAAIAADVMFETTVTEPCGLDCNCRQYVGDTGFPTTCLRYAPGVQELLNEVAK